MTFVSMICMCGMKTADDTITEIVVPEVVVEQKVEKTVDEPKEEPVVEEIATPEEEPELPVPEMQLSKEDIDLIALVTMAEAEGESEYGKRLVIDTILNRVDSEYFPDTVYGVIYQANQFSSMWDGRAARCYVRNDIVSLVEEELMTRNNHEVMFFTAGAYGNYGTRMFQEGNHYFCSY